MNSTIWLVVTLSLENISKKKECIHYLIGMIYFTTTNGYKVNDPNERSVSTTTQIIKSSCKCGNTIFLHHTSRQIVVYVNVLLSMFH